MNRIDSFRGPNRWLSNFHEAEVVFDGVSYPTNEHAYQAQKSANPVMQKVALSFTKPVDVMHRGRSFPPREDWENLKLDIMYRINLDKYTRHTELREKLLATADDELVEGNWWHDSLWGSCTCGTCPEGQNELGKVLMRVRAELRGTK